MREVITRKSETATVKISSPWLSIDEACVYLGISRVEFYQLSARHSIPFKIVGKRRKYHCDDLDAYNKPKPSGAPDEKKIPGP